MARRRAFAEAGEGGGGHDGGGSMRWLLTYADMITLLTAFFIMMYSMSVLNLAKFKEVAISVRSGFGGKLEGAGIYEKGGVVYMDPKAEVPDPAPSLDIVMKKMDEYIARHGLERDVKCRLEARGLVISLTSDGLLFDRGQARVRPEAKAVLDAVSHVIANVSNEVLVEGHTCSLPISTMLYPSNWELSTARATAVVRYLMIRHGIPARRIGAAGYADSRPFAVNDTEAHRRLNRRVNVVVLAGSATVVKDAQTAPVTPPPASVAKKGGTAERVERREPKAAHATQTKARPAHHDAKPKQVAERPE